jgi:ATP adenylyltransferase
MEHLWAPWRMTYINKDAKPAECIFCDKLAEQRDAENLILYRGGRCFVIMNLFPYNNGHLMVAPYAHLPSIEELDRRTLADLMSTAQQCLAALHTAMHPDGFNMGINQGHVAGAGIADHVHLHVVPRWNGDTNFMPVLADTKVMPDFLQNTYRQLKAAWPTLKHREGSAPTSRSARAGAGSAPDTRPRRAAPPTRPPSAR